jgi:hypothetical protein
MNNTGEKSCPCVTTHIGEGEVEMMSRVFSERVFVLVFDYPVTLLDSKVVLRLNMKPR